MRLRSTVYWASVWCMVLALSTASAEGLKQRLIDLKQRYQQSEDRDIASLESVAITRLANQAAQPLTEIGIPEGEELILSVYVDNVFLGDIFAIKSQANALLGFSNLIQVLDFPIDFTEDFTQASGWFIEPTQLFSYQWEKQDEVDVLINHNGESLRYPTQYARLEDDVYFESEMIAEWFNFSFAFDFRDLKVTLTSQQLLPIQQQLIRRNRRTQSSTTTNQASLPRKDTPYQLISDPVLDIQLNTSYNNDTFRQGYSILGANDLAYFNAQYHLSGNSEDSLTDIRINLTKEEADATLLGPLKATRLELGDISPVSIGLNSRAGLGRGLKITNTPLTQNTSQNRTQFQGNVQPGWDVELYRNSILVASQFSSEAGRYEFNDIDLFFGNNVFELVFYGPQGQIERETQQFFVSNTALSTRQGLYSFALTQPGQAIIDVSNTTSTSDALLFSGRYDLGLTHWLSTYLGSTHLLDQNDTENTYATGIDLTILNRLLLNLDYRLSDDDSQVVEYNARSQVAGQSINVRYRDSEQISSSAELTHSSEYQLSVNGTLFRQSLLPVNYQQTFEIGESDNQSRQLMRNALAFSALGTNFNHELTWLNNNIQTETTTNGITTIQTNQQETLDASLRSQHNFNRLFWRNQLDYGITPQFQAVRLNSEASVILTPTLDAKLSYTKTLSTDTNQVGLGLVWRPRNISFSSNAIYSDISGWSLNAFARFSVGKPEKSPSFFMSQQSLANNGSLSVRVFEDLNLNQHYDIGEPELEGVSVKSIQNYRQGVTDKNGIAILPSMQNFKATDIRLDVGTLPDPYMIPSIDGASISPRRGFIDHLDFPVVRASEIEGTVYLQQGRNSLFATYATLFLLDEAGTVVSTTRTEFDGYYLFTDILPGRYQLQIDPDYIVRRNLKPVTNRLIDLEQGNKVISGFDFVLKPPRQLQGFVTQIGTFSNLNHLNAYWLLLTRQYPSLKQLPSVYYSELDDSFELHSGFYKTETEAIEACQLFTSLTLDCEVQAQQLD